MTIFKPYPEVRAVSGQIDGLWRIETNTGRVLAAGHFQSKLEAERFAECWNACRKLAFPSAHIEAIDGRVTRLEQLRKEAWARAQELEAELAALRKASAEVSVSVALSDTGMFQALVGEVAQ